MLISQYHYDLFADYFQFYIQDEQVEGNLSDSWTKEASRIGLALAPCTVGIGTARNMTVPVTLEVHDSVPDDDFTSWERVNECSIDIPSGCLVIAGCTDYFPDAARIYIKPQCYRARIYYGGLNTVVDEFGEGDDYYKVVLWPEPYSELKVIKEENQ